MKMDQYRSGAPGSDSEPFSRTRDRGDRGLRDPYYDIPGRSRHDKQLESKRHGRRRGTPYFMFKCLFEINDVYKVISFKYNVQVWGGG